MQREGTIEDLYRLEPDCVRVTVGVGDATHPSALVKWVLSKAIPRHPTVWTSSTI